MADELRMLVRLNRETRSHHADADADVDTYLFSTPVTREDYRTYLARVYGFVAPLEAALVGAPGLTDVIDLRERAKTPLLAADLLALGMSMDEVHALPQCQTIPTFRGPAAALGWLYVIERPLLSAAVIRGHLVNHLPAEMTSASAYFLGYQGQVGGQWRELGEAMDLVAYAPSIEDRIVTGAHDGFRALLRWRDADHAREHGIVRIAVAS